MKHLLRTVENLYIKNLTIFLHWFYARPIRKPSFVGFSIDSMVEGLGGLLLFSYLLCTQRICFCNCYFSTLINFTSIQSLVIQWTFAGNGLEVFMKTGEVIESTFITKLLYTQLSIQ